MKKISVRNLRESNGYWMWTIVENDGFEVTTTDYCTNRFGHGIFIDSPNMPQVTGTAQFNLTSNKKTNYQRVRRHFSW